MTYSGFAPYPEIGVPGTIVVDIDDRRRHRSCFADASGSGKMTAYVEFPGALSLGPWPASWTWKAKIKY